MLNIKQYANLKHQTTNFKLQYSYKLDGICLVTSYNVSTWVKIVLIYAKILL